jgi:hypothetical protein
VSTPRAGPGRRIRSSEPPVTPRWHARLLVAPCCAGRGACGEEQRSRRGAVSTWQKWHAAVGRARPARRAARSEGRAPQDLPGRAGPERGREREREGEEEERGREREGEREGEGEGEGERERGGGGGGREGGGESHSQRAARSSAARRDGAPQRLTLRGAHPAAYRSVEPQDPPGRVGPQSIGRSGLSSAGPGRGAAAAAAPSRRPHAAAARRVRETGGARGGGAANCRQSQPSTPPPYPTPPPAPPPTARCARGAACLRLCRH